MMRNVVVVMTMCVFDVRERPMPLLVTLCATLNGEV
jgi:hypothetical protein